MLYIHQNTCISPQLTSGTVNLNELQLSVNNQLKAIEPAEVYQAIPPSMFRRMGKAVRLASGAALPLLNSHKFDGIIIGTAYGGLEDCIKFLNQIVQYNEGRLTPTNFVQSTTNAVASQLAFFSTNKGHNSTHVHRGLAFENALLEAAMLLKENPTHTYLVCGVDEISDYEYNIDDLAGWHKKAPTLNTDLYSSYTPGSIPGEACVALVANNQKENAVACVKKIEMFHSTNEKEVAQHFKDFIQKNNMEVDILLSGECGDNRLTHFYTAVENTLPKETSIAHYKHMCGEYATSSSFALWLAANILQAQQIPAHVIKHQGEKKSYKNILIYNSFRKKQHSFIWVTKSY